jgi:hypothetical protein
VFTLLRKKEEIVVLIQNLSGNEGICWVLSNVCSITLYLME